MLSYLEKDYERAKTLFESIENIDTLDEKIINQLDDITFLLIRMRQHAAQILKRENLP